VSCFWYIYIYIYIFDITIILSFRLYLSYHPRILDLNKQLSEAQNEKNALAKTLRLEISEALLLFEPSTQGDDIDLFFFKWKNRFDNNERVDYIERKNRVYSRCSIIEKGQEDNMKCPMRILNVLEDTIKAVSTIVKKQDLTQESILDLVINNSGLLSGLLDVKTDQEKQKEGHRFSRSKTLKELTIILKLLTDVQSKKLFDCEHARTIVNKVKHLEEDIEAQTKFLTKQLSKDARIQMATIGSSHKIPGRSTSDDESIEELMDEQKIDTPNSTVVIIDEAGCIPDFEFLGLSRICEDMIAIVLVGDQKQLPPYNPGNLSKGRPPFKRAGSKNDMPDRSIQKSLLDMSQLTSDNGKVYLVEQYRIPIDIADILSVRVYNNNYKTSTKANVPLNGLKFVHVPLDLNPRKKYVNSNEVEEILTILQTFMRRDVDNILILTPVRSID